MTQKSKEGRNVPNLRFPDYKDDWREEKLGNSMDFKVTNSFSRNDLNYDNGAVKNIHYGDIHTKYQTLFDINREVVPYVNKNISLNRISDDYYCKEGDLVFADASEDLNDVGKSMEIIHLNNEKLLSGLHTLLARPKQGLFFKGFNGYLFKSKNIRLQIQKEAQGTKVLSISAKRISNIKLSFPLEKEQEKITSFLSKLDQRIQTQIKIIQRLESLMKGLMQKIFSQKIRFKDDFGNQFPDWEKKKLGEILIEVNKKTTTSNQYPILSSTTNGLFKQSDYFNRDIASKDNTGYKILKKYQLVFSPQNLWLGNININCDFEIGIVSPSYKVFDFKTSFTSYNFCRYFLFTSKMFYEYSQASEQGASVVRRNLDMSSFYAISIKLPKKEEQTRIANFLSSIDEKIEKEKQILTQYQQQKMYLLQNLFI